MCLHFDVRNCFQLSPIQVLTCPCSSCKQPQKEELRARFPGVPGDLVNYFLYVAEEVNSVNLLPLRFTVVLVHFIWIFPTFGG